jgi:hypothetical protein
VKKILTLLTAILLFSQSFAQQNPKNEDKQYKLMCVAFYNLENLFDTIVDPDTNLILREDFTPLGAKNWNTEKYYKKLDNLAKVISMLGTEKVPTGPAVIGVAEVENRSVLDDLVKRPAIINRNYKIVHYDSPDERGIDVAFLYQPDKFKLIKSWVRHETSLPNGDKTRDMLAIYGELDGEPFYFIVDHWPSRRGGQKRSEPLRDSVAKHDRQVIDSILALNPGAKVIYMGDLNDDPVDESVKKYMNASGKIKKLKEGQLYNPMEEKFKRGIGTLAYNDAWNLFDQFMMTQSLIDTKDLSTYKFLQAKIFSKNFMKQKSGRFEGYPLRTYVGNEFTGGYSDHFPVYLFLYKELK